jgi:hypothetical protein
VLSLVSDYREGQQPVRRCEGRLRLTGRGMARSRWSLKEIARSLQLVSEEQVGLRRHEDDSPHPTLAIAAKNRPDMSPTHHDNSPPRHRPGVEKRRASKERGEGRGRTKCPSPCQPQLARKKSDLLQNFDSQIPSSYFEATRLHERVGRVRCACLCAYCTRTEFPLGTDSVALRVARPFCLPLLLPTTNIVFPTYSTT